MRRIRPRGAVSARRLASGVAAFGDFVVRRVGGALIAKAGATSVTTAPVFLGGFFLGGLCWTIFICGLGSHGRKRAGTGLLRACHVLSALLFAYFSYSVIVNGYRDLIVQTAHVAS